MPKEKVELLQPIKKIPDDELDNYYFLEADIASPKKEIDELIDEINQTLTHNMSKGINPSRVLVFAVNVLAANDLISAWKIKHDA